MFDNTKPYFYQHLWLMFMHLLITNDVLNIY